MQTIDILDRLIAFPTVSRDPNRELMEFVRAYLAERGWFSRPRVDHVIIPEPLNVDRVCIGHRGVWWAEIETKGRIAHGSMPFLGDSAIRHMAADGVTDFVEVGPEFQPSYA